MATRGRKTKYKKSYAKEAFKLCAKEGYTDRKLAAHFHISVSTLNVWKHQYPEFLESLRKGKEQFDTVKIEQVLKRKALRGNLGAIKMWLFNRNPDRWRRKMEIEQTGEITVKAVHFCKSKKCPNKKK